MAEYIKIPTSAEVAAVIRARHHKQLKCFESFSDPDGTFNGGPGERGRMETAYGFEGAECPILCCKTTWDIDGRYPHRRINETHEYWLCVASGDEYAD